MGRLWIMNPSGSYSNSRDDKQANKQHKQPKLISCLLSAPLCCSSRGTGLHFPCHNSLGAPIQDLMRLSQPRDWRRQFFDLKIKGSKKNLLSEKRRLLSHVQHIPELFPSPSCLDVVLVPNPLSSALSPVPKQ